MKRLVVRTSNISQHHSAATLGYHQDQRLSRIDVQFVADVFDRRLDHQSDGSVNAGPIITQEVRTDPIVSFFYPEDYYVVHSRVGTIEPLDGTLASASYACILPACKIILQLAGGYGNENSHNHIYTLPLGVGSYDQLFH